MHLSWAQPCIMEFEETTLSWTLQHWSWVSHPSDLSCVFCFEINEDLVHLLLSCVVSTAVWNIIADWVGKPYVSYEDICGSFLGWNEFFKSRKVKIGKENLVWLAVTWPLWRARKMLCLTSKVAFQTLFGASKFWFGSGPLSENFLLLPIVVFMNLAKLLCFI